MKKLFLIILTAICSGWAWADDVGEVAQSLAVMSIGQIITTGIFILLGLSLLGFIAYKIIKGTKPRFKDGKLSFGGGIDLTFLIPRIDEDTKRKNRSLIDEQRELLEYDLPEYFPDSVRMLTASKLRIPLYNAVSENHFAAIFSDPISEKEWTQKQLGIINSYIKILRYRCHTEMPREVIDYLISPAFEDYINRHLDYMKGIFKANTAAAVSEKLTLYNKMEDGEQKKELINKSEKYLRGLK